MSTSGGDSGSNRDAGTAELTRVQEWAFERVTFAYGPTPALEDISLRAQAGEILALVGPNGCGKSTLLRLLTGELRPQAGRILVDGREIAEIGRIGMARRVALVPQQGTSGSAFDYSVRDMVLMARYALHAERGGWFTMGFETDADLAAADRAMWTADVHHLADRPFPTLSGGERQRVTIARVLAQETPVLLLDEPTSALDLYHALELLEELRRLAAEERRIIVLVTHDLELAYAHATQTALLDRGRVIRHGPTHDALTPEAIEAVYQVGAELHEGRLIFARLAKRKS